MKNFNIYDPMKKGQGLTLDGQALAHVEVLLNSEGTEEGSLLQLLGRCVTSFGQSNPLIYNIMSLMACIRKETVPYLAVYALARSRRHQF